MMRKYFLWQSRELLPACDPADSHHILTQKVELASTYSTAHGDDYSSGSTKLHRALSSCGLVPSSPMRAPRISSGYGIAICSRRYPTKSLGMRFVYLWSTCHRESWMYMIEDRKLSNLHHRSVGIQSWGIYLLDPPTDPLAGRRKMLPASPASTERSRTTCCNHGLAAAPSRSIPDIPNFPKP